MERYTLTDTVNGECRWPADFADEKAACSSMLFIYEAYNLAKGKMRLTRIDGSEVDYEAFVRERLKQK